MESSPLPPNPPVPPTPPASAPLGSEERNWAMAMPLSALITSFGVFLPVIIPLVIWLIKKETSQFCDAVGKETLNAQISYLIYVIVSLLLTLIFIGIIGIFAVIILDIVCSIIAAIKASEGVVYRYPLIIRFIK